MDEDEQGQFEGKAGGGDGMEVLGKTGSQLTEGGFDSFAKMLEQKLLSRRMRPLAALLPRRDLLAASGLGEDVFQRLVGVGVVGVEDAACGQIHGHRPQARAVGVDIKLDRHPLAGGNDLHLEAIKPLPLAGRAAPVGLARQKLTARNANEEI